MASAAPATAAPTLAQLGWSVARRLAFAPHRAAGWLPGRVTSVGGRATAITERGPTQLLVQRRAARDAVAAAGPPAVGDWVAVEPVSEAPRRGALRAILPRSGAFLRDHGDGRPQVIAANVDVAFLVSGLDHDLNPRRIERYLVLAYDGGVTPVVVLNKVDIALDLDGAVTAVHAVAAGVRVIVTSALTGEGVEEVRAFLASGLTGCLLGSSGVGKSTLLNRLLGEERQAVRPTRADDSRGRHTTAHRELFAIPGGGLVIDTPGLRSVGLLDDGDGLAVAFDDIERLARGCRFADCRHGAEPGCAVLAALEAGSLATRRYESFRKLDAERRSAELRSDERARRRHERQLGRRYRHDAALVARHKRHAG